ncbi:MAG: hypothetical protein NZ518_10600, partial [Dehalococcoidia bacterium]|nr:hypothetical protein [Dehalococcoidia bacterium]
VMPFRIAAIVPTAKCAVTEVIGSVRDGGAPARGYVVRVVSLTDPTFAPRLSRPIGDDGAYEITLARAPLAGRWEVSLLAPNRQQAGATAVIETTGSDCHAGGRQSFTVNYRR